MSSTKDRYVCMYVCMYACMHVCMYVCYVCVCVCVCVCVGKQMPYGSSVVRLTHTQVCGGTCTVSHCLHRAHRSARKAPRTRLPIHMREAITAGFKNKPTRDSRKSGSGH